MKFWTRHRSTSTCHTQQKTTSCLPITRHDLSSTCLCMFFIIIICFCFPINQIIRSVGALKFHKAAMAVQLSGLWMPNCPAVPGYSSQCRSKSLSSTALSATAPLSSPPPTIQAIITNLYIYLLQCIIQLFILYISTYNLQFSLKFTRRFLVFCL